jgi:gluconolactonase
MMIASLRWFAVLATSLCFGGVFCISSAVVCSGQELAVDGLGTFSAAKKLAGDLQFTEGPTWSPNERLLFSDIPANRIMLWKRGDKAEVFLEPSHKANGLMFDSAGTLIACQMEGALVAIETDSKAIHILADKYEGKPLNAPNDLIIDMQGGVYFTDPHYGAPMPLPQGKMAVYYRSAEGTLTRLVDDLKAPNGIALSPDEMTLYVVPSEQKEVMQYTISAPGVIDKGKVITTLQQPKGTSNSGGDGMTVDEQGNLYATSQLGVQIISPQGKVLGIIALPEVPANVTFGGKERRTLFITARTSLYQVDAPVSGIPIQGRVPLPSKN